MKRNKMFLLALILCTGLLTVSIGTTYARYRDEQQEVVTFAVREPNKVLLGTVEDEVFTPAEQLEWSVDDGVASLQLAVANGSSETDYTARDQIIRLYMIGSLGIAENGTPPEVLVTFLTQGEQAESKTVQAYATPIEKNTALYHTYGEGWKYGFYELTAEGSYKEITWELAGGDLNYVTMIVTTKVGNTESVSLWYPLIAADANTQ